MKTITKNSPSDYFIKELQSEGRAVFGSRFKDLNEINSGEMLRVYLTDKLPGDEAKFDKLLADHSPANILSSQQSKKNDRKNRKRSVMTKLGITKGDIVAIKELLEDGNDD